MNKIKSLKTATTAQGRRLPWQEAGRVPQGHQHCSGTHPTVSRCVLKFTWHRIHLFPLISSHTELSSRWKPTPTLVTSHSHTSFRLTQLVYPPLYRFVCTGHFRSWHHVHVAFCIWLLSLNSFFKAHLHQCKPKSPIPFILNFPLCMDILQPFLYSFISWWTSGFLLLFAMNTHGHILVNMRVQFSWVLGQLISVVNLTASRITHETPGHICEGLSWLD